MKRFFLFICILCAVFCVSCKNKNAEKKSEISEILPAESEKANLSYNPIFSIEEREYFGSIAKATVNDNFVNVRLMPSQSSEKVDLFNKGDVVEIRGFSDKREVIDGYNGYWLKVSIEKGLDGYYSDWCGWIFSKYVDVPNEIEASSFSVIDTELSEDGRVSKLKLKITRYNEDKEVTIYPSKMPNQSFYTFVWSDDISDFMFCDPVGTFKWFPETNEIRHITYMGDGEKSAWCLISDDEKYLFKDFGTAPGVRGLGIFEIATNKSIFSGSYLRDLEYVDDSMTVVEACTSWAIREKYVSEETIRHAEEYKKQLPEEKLSRVETGLDFIVVRYRFNLNTREKSYLDCLTMINW